MRSPSAIVTSMLACKTVVAVIALVCTLQFHSHMNKPYFRRRIVSLILFQIYFLWIWLIASTTVLGTEFFNPNYDVTRHTNYNFVEWTWVFGAFVLWTLRFHLLGFMHRFEESKAKQQWEQQLEEFEETELRWYEDNKKTLGNPTWLIQRFCVPVAIIYCVVSAVHLVFRRSDLLWALWTLSYVAVVGICCVVAYMAWRSFPVIRDRLYLRAELERKLLLIFVTAITMGIVALSCFFVRDVSGNYVCWSIDRIVIPDIAKCFALLISTVIVIKENENIPAVEYDDRLNWRELAAWGQSSFQAFAHHLQSEFAVESLLFLMEYAAFKRVLHKEIKFLLKQEGLELDFPPEIMGKSSMFIESLLPVSIETCGKFLYEKYITPDSNLVVNIGWDERKALMDLFDRNVVIHHAGIERVMSNELVDSVDESTQLRQYRIVKAYDDVARDVSHLLRASFNRFLATEEYLKCMELKERTVSLAGSVVSVLSEIE